MGPYTNPLWNQMAVLDDYMLVDNRRAKPVQLRPAVLKLFHRGYTGQDGMLGVSRYLWWPHIDQDIVNLAEDCRSCSRYVENAKNQFQKIALKRLPLLTQPG